MLRESTTDYPTTGAPKYGVNNGLELRSRKLSQVEADLQAGLDHDTIAPAGFYEAMRHFLTLREKMFPHLPADPAWNILVTLASTAEGDARNSVTGIAYGAGVPLTTALRYIGIMEVEGIVERVADPSDHRRVFIQLTREGRDRLDAIASQWRARAAVLMTLVPLAVAWALRAAGIV